MADKDVTNIVNSLTKETPILKKRPSNPDVDKAFTQEMRDQLGYMNPYRTLSDYADMDELINNVRGSVTNENSDKVNPIIDLMIKNKDYFNSLRQFDRQYDKDYLDFQKSSDYKNAFIDAMLEEQPVKRSDWYKKTGDMFRSKYGYDPSTIYEGMVGEKWNSKGRELSQDELAALNKKYPNGHFFHSTFLSRPNQTLEGDLSSISIDDLRKYLAYKLGGK